MQAFVRRKDLMDLYKSFDKIHDPSVYDIGPNDSEWVEVDTFQMNFSEQEAALTANSEALPKPPQQLKWRSPTLHNLDRLILKNKIAQNQALIRETIKATSSIIIPRTQAHNRKWFHGAIPSKSPPNRVSPLLVRVTADFILSKIPQNKYFVQIKLITKGMAAEGKMN